MFETFDFSMPVHVVEEATFVENLPTLNRMPCCINSSVAEQ